MAHSTSTHIRQLLRILTPEEINELTTTSASFEKTSLTEIMEKELLSKSSSKAKIESEEAKILPFDHPEKEEVKDVKVTSGQRVSQILDHFLEEVEMSKGSLFKKARRSKTYKEKPKEMSTFIIEEKRKSEKSYHQLKSREVIHLYKKNASIDIEQQKKNEDDLSRVGQSGLLVNKK